MAHPFDPDSIDETAMVSAIFAKEMAKREIERRILELEDELEYALMELQGPPVNRKLKIAP